ncbi:hypothetical protein V8B97DRAFT_1915979 [Scleroderma yunnanense]
MNWLASLFSGGNKQSLRRGQAMSTTHEAFSLPTSSPRLTPQTDTYNTNSSRTTGPLSPSYTYPPQSPISAYSYVPTSSTSRSRPTSLLPLHHTPHTDALTPPPSYPPLSNTWNRIKFWLAREYPELGDTLNYGILPQDLAQIEMHFGFALPAPIRESYLVVNGQEAESSAGCADGLFFGLTLLPLEDVVEEWKFWREVDEDPTTGANTRLQKLMKSIPDGWVRKEYSQRGWIPLIVDKTGNYIGIDLNPGESGSIGQVIVFGRDFDTKVVLWRGDGLAGWATWLACFADELESGEGFELGQGNSESEGSEDGIGYENYFHDGTGGGQGDGGGEAGSGGLRLNGEYKGWNPIEAWADRSVKKWRDAGLLASDAPSIVNGKTPAKHGLGVLNLQDSSAVVPIPVLEEKLEEESTALPVAPNATPRPSLPTISITKAPPPLPIGVPTANDVLPLPSPPDSRRSSSDDIEAGRGLGYRESMDESTHPQAMPHPLSIAKKPDLCGVQSSLPTVVDDFLADSTPLEAVPTMRPAKIESEISAQEYSPGSEPSLSSQPVAEEPIDTTIRLVSESRLSGSEPTMPLTNTIADAETSGDALQDPVEVQPRQDKTHEKNSSSSSLARKSTIADEDRQGDSSSTNSIPESR